MQAPPANAEKFSSTEGKLGFRGRRPTDLPDDLIFRNRVKPSNEKYFSFPEAQISCISSPSRRR
jgi:hypothetical protein